jgi:hypothetical protein
MAKRGAQPKVGLSRANKNPHWWPDNSPRLKGPGRTQPKSFGAHVKRVASQPKLSGNKKRR